MSVLLLGNVLSAWGISVYPKSYKSEGLVKPNNVQGVHSFIGFTSYNCKFIAKFAETAQCLHQLTGPISTKTKKEGQMSKEGESRKSSC